MLMHHDALRLLTHERMNSYLREAAADRRARIAAAAAPRRRAWTKAPAAWLWGLVARALAPDGRERSAACRETGRSAS